MGTAVGVLRTADGRVGTGHPWKHGYRGSHWEHLWSTPMGAAVGALLGANVGALMGDKCGRNNGSPCGGITGEQIWVQVWGRCNAFQQVPQTVDSNLKHWSPSS
jgi:hypothetical protein